KLLFRIRRMKDTAPFAAMSVREWLDTNIEQPRGRETLEAFFRLATCCTAMDKMNAAAALTHLRIAMRGGMDIDEGWQKLVDALHSSAVAAGVNFVTSSRVVRVNHDSAVREIEIGGLEYDTQSETGEFLLPARGETHGTRLAADTVLLAVDPD